MKYTSVHTTTHKKTPSAFNQEQTQGAHTSAQASQSPRRRVLAKPVLNSSPDGVGSAVLQQLRLEKPIPGGFNQAAISPLLARGPPQWGHFGVTEGLSHSTELLLIAGRAQLHMHGGERLLGLF